MGVLTAALRRIDPEVAHGLALRAVRVWPGGGGRNDGLATRLAGVALANPIGLAAGFDKDATALAGLARLGFGWIEAGTVTLRPQPGNPRPRLFRLTEDGAVVNRMGFNNGGLEGFARRLAESRVRVPVCANIGLNREGAEPLADYAALAAGVGRVAYIAINVSSPNTPGLRDLQAPRHLAAILDAIHRAVPGAPPLFVKLAPDLADAALPDIVAACCDGGSAGLIVGNTTLARPPGLRGSAAVEAGGLSGRPLMAPSTAMLRRVAGLGRGRLALVGVGGIASGLDVLAKLRVGADAVQLYTALALQGPGLVRRLKRELRAALDGRSVASVVGADM